MKKKFINVVVVISGVILLAIYLWKGGKDKVEYNNELGFNELVTYRYSSDELHRIQQYIADGTNISLFEIIDSDKMECARKLEDTRYIILLSDKDEKLFVFFNSDYVITAEYYVEEEFLGEKDFEKIQVGITRESDIETLDKSTIYYDVSVETVTGHIVKEGIIIIEYDRFSDGKILNDPLVKKIKVYKNDEILNVMKLDFFVMSTPFILSIDKEV